MLAAREKAAKQERVKKTKKVVGKMCVILTPFLQMKQHSAGQDFVLFAVRLQDLLKVDQMPFWWYESLRDALEQCMLMYIPLSPYSVLLSSGRRYSGKH